MPILRRTPRECFDFFEAHMRHLVAETLTRTYPLQLLVTDGSRRANLSFRQRMPVAVPVATRLGRLYLFLSQSLEALEQPRADASERFRLETHQYWYRLQEAPEASAPAIMRWEYRRSAAKYCRHHVHVAGTVRVGDDHLDLHKVHLPTGWVTIEAIIRFLITDLEVKPLSEQWSNLLLESERIFYTDFTGKRYVPPAPSDGR